MNLRKEYWNACEQKHCSCGKYLPDYKIELCCSGTECGCKGLPIEPPICNGCYERYSTKNNHQGKD